VKGLSAETMLALIEEAPDCFVLLAEDGTFRYVNAPAEGAVERGLLRPDTAYIQKPFRAQDLTEKIRSLLA
jgi:hypothetical protein